MKIRIDLRLNKLFRITQRLMSSSKNNSLLVIWNIDWNGNVIVTIRKCKTVLNRIPCLVKKKHREFSKSAPELPRSKKLFYQMKTLSYPLLVIKRFFRRQLLPEKIKFLSFKKPRFFDFFPTSQIKKSPFSEDYPEWKKYRNEKMVLFGCFWTSIQMECYDFALVI